MSRGRRPKWMIELGKERIDILFNLAEKEFSQHPERSHRYVKLARNISTKYNIKMSLEWRRRFCKSCYKFLKPGQNSVIKLSNGEIHFKCLECGKLMRLPYINEKKQKRRNKIESYLVKKRVNE
ncbi:MAG: ribonuclease P protein component 4 [Euryarchaeota archaeon]